MRTVEENYARLDERVDAGLSTISELRKELTQFINESRKYRAIQDERYYKIAKTGSKNIWTERASAAGGGGGIVAGVWFILERLAGG